MRADAEMVLYNTDEYLQTEKFPPTISDLVKQNETVIFKRRKQLALQQQKEDAEREKLAVPPPWITQGITKEEYTQKIKEKYLLMENNDHE